MGSEINIGMYFNRDPAKPVRDTNAHPHASSRQAQPLVVGAVNNCTLTTPDLYSLLWSGPISGDLIAEMDFPSRRLLFSEDTADFGAGVFFNYAS